MANLPLELGIIGMCGQDYSEGSLGLSCRQLYGGKKEVLNVAAAVVVSRVKSAVEERLIPFLPEAIQTVRTILAATL